MTDLVQHLTRQIAFSRATFGPGDRREGVTHHIRKELKEIADGNGDPKEWVDVVILALDGLWRSLDSRYHGPMPGQQTAQAAVNLIVEKQSINELRTWPDWRTAAADKAIEHDRSAEKPACPVCSVAFEPADLCATDIELGICHAACLEGSPAVNLDTGAPVSGPVATYRYDETGDA